MLAKPTRFAGRPAAHRRTRRRCTALGVIVAAVLCTRLAVAATHQPDPAPVLPTERLFALGATDDYADFAGLVYTPRALAIGAAGSVVVADTGHHRIQVFAADGALVRLWGGRGSEEGRFAAPQGVAVGPSPERAVVVADTGNNRIQVFREDGSFVRSHTGAEGGGQGLRSPGAVAVAADGTIFVADTGNNRVVALADGSPSRSWGSTGSAPGEFNRPEGIAVSPDGTVFVADTGNQRVQLFTPAGVFQSQWAADVGSPVAISVGAGRAWVLDGATGIVNILTTVGRKVGAALLADAILAVVATADGSAVVADTSSVIRTNSSGEPTTALRTPEDHPWVFPFASALAVAPDDTLYIAMGGYDEIRHFDATGTLLRRIRGSWSDDDTGCLGPGAMDVGPDGTLHVVDVCEAEVDRYRPDGSPAGTWSARGTGPGQYLVPTGIVVEADGSFHIADGPRHRILSYDAAGAFVRQFGRQGAAAGEFSFPAAEDIPPTREVGMAIDETGRLVVADAGNQRLQVFDAGGTFVRSVDARLANLNPDREPSGMPGAIATGGGRLFSADSLGGVVAAFDATGGLHSVIGDACAQTTAAGVVCHPETGGSVEDFPASVAGVGTLVNGTVVVLDLEKVLMYRPDGLLLGRWGLFGTATGAFRVPAGGLNALSDAGEPRVAAADESSSRYHAFDLEGSPVGIRPHAVASSAVAQAGRRAVPFPDLVALDQAPGGDLLVADGVPGLVRRADGLEAAVSTFWPKPDLEPISGLRAITGGGSMILGANGASGVLRTLDDDGSDLGDVPVAADAGPFDVDAHGKTYAISADRAHVEVRGAGQNQPVVWGPGGDIEAPFENLVDVAVAADGSVYVADTGRGVIDRRSASGEPLGAWGDDPAAALADITALTSAPDGRVWVADRGGARLTAYGPPRTPGWRATYFRDRWLTDHYAFAERLARPERDYGQDPPGPGLPADGWSLRLERTLHLDGGTHVFGVDATGGYRLWVGEALIADAWEAQDGGAPRQIELAAGRYLVRFEFNDRGGEAAFHLDVPDESAAPTPPATTPTPTRPRQSPRLTPTAPPIDPAPWVRVVDLPVNDLVYSPMTHRILAGVAGKSPPSFAALVEINPEAAAVTSRTTLPDEPGRMSIDPSGRMAYAGLEEMGHVFAYDLLAIEDDATFPTGPVGGRTVDVATSPTNPWVVAALTHIGTHTEVAVLDRGRRRSLGAILPGITGVDFGTTETSLYAADDADRGTIHRFAVDSGGISTEASRAGLDYEPGADVQHAAGRLYLSTGQVMEASTLQEAGRAAGIAGNVFIADPATSRAYAVWSGAVHVYRLADLAPLGTVQVAGLATDPVRLVRWGADGLAMTDAERLWLVRDPLIAGDAPPRVLFLPLATTR